MLATSREPLGVAGEVTFGVPPLAVADSTDPGQVRNVEAVRLFVDRAGLVDPGFEQAKLDPDVKGATVEFINRIQKELGLPERLHYFPKKLPGRDDVLCIYFGNTQRVEIDAKLF